MSRKKKRISTFDEIIKDGIKKGYFEINDGRIKYIAQNYSDNFNDPEEKVRAALFYDLIEKYNYKNEKRIIDFEKKRVIGHPDKTTYSMVDILVYREDGTPFTVIETKSQNDYDKMFEDSIKTQLFERAANEDKGSGNVKYLIYYTRFYEDNELIKKFETIDYLLYKDWDQWEEAGRPNLRIIPKNYDIVDTPPQFIKGDENPENRLRDNVRKDELNRIATDLHNVLWGGGEFQNELFFNLIGMFLTKIYDEKTKSDGEPYDFQIFFEGTSAESPQITYDRINKLYRGAKDEDTKIYSQCALNYLLGFDDTQLDKMPDIVFDANKVKYVVEVLQSISFTANKYDVLGDFFEKIVRTELKQTKGQYLTHHNIVDFIVKALKVDDLAISLINGDDGRPRLPYIIDPSCGSGTFQIQCMKEITSRVVNEKETYKNLKKTDDVEEFVETNFPTKKQNVWAKEYIYGVETNKDLAMATKVNMVGHGDGSANIFRADGLIEFSKFNDAKLLNVTKTDSEYDFPVNEQFDIVVSNPPFSVMVDRETAKVFPDIYQQGEKIKKSLKKEKQKEIDTENLFLERWYQLLRPGGRLGVVLPESVFDTTSNRAIRLFIFKYYWVKAIVSLPHLAFAPYTMTKTSLLFAMKKTSREVNEWNTKWSEYEEKFKSAKSNYDNVKKRKETDEMKLHFIESLKKLLIHLYDDKDNHLSITALKEKYSEDLKQIDSDWWCFSKIANSFNYNIFMAHAEEIGYKRGANREELRNNELFNSVFENEKSIIKIDIKNPKSILDYLLNNIQW